MASIPETIQLTSEQHSLLAEITLHTGRPWEQVLSQALREFKSGTVGHAPAGESVRDAMLRLGLLGCIKDAPADLSTNPAYLEGFGQDD